MIRRIGEPVRRDIRYTLRPGAYVVLRRGGLILLTHQAAPVPELQLPGGGIDPGEHPGAALHREVVEETGWTMALGRRLGAFRRYTYMPEYDLWAEKLCTFYAGRPGRRRGPPVEAGHMAVWLPFADAAEALGNPVDKHVVRMLARSGL